MIRAILIAVMLATAVPAEVITIDDTSPDRLGGFVRQFAIRINNVDARGDSMRIESRSCASACTLYLTLNDVCVMRYTRFKFHRVSKWGVLPMADMDAYMVGMYDRVSPSLGARYRAVGSKRGWVPDVLTGAELIDQYGVRECK